MGHSISNDWNLRNNKYFLAIVFPYIVIEKLDLDKDTLGHVILKHILENALSLVR